MACWPIAAHAAEVDLDGMHSMTFVKDSVMATKENQWGQIKNQPKRELKGSRNQKGQFSIIHFRGRISRALTPWPTLQPKHCSIRVETQMPRETGNWITLAFPSSP